MPDQDVYIDPRECGLLVRWAIEHYGGISPALKAAEAVGAWMLASNEAWREKDETTAEHMPFYIDYINRVREERHCGDCYRCASWLVASMTCAACVYDEYVAKAWEALRIENGGLEWRCAP